MRHGVPILLIAAALTLRLATVSLAQARYEGAFASGRLAMELHQDGERLTGNVRINDTLCALTGSVRDDRFTAEFDFNGQRFPLEAGMDAGVLVVVSGGVTHRLVRQDAPGNPLADPTLTQPESPVTPVPPPDVPSPAAEVPELQTDPPLAPANAASVEQRYPMVLDLGSGASIRYPEGWTQRKMGALTALTPAPTADRPTPSVAYVAQVVPWPAGSALGPEAEAQVASAVTGLVPGLRRDGEPEPLGGSFADGIRLRFTSSAISAGSKVRVLAKSKDASLVVMLGLGDDRVMQTDEPMLIEMIGTVVHENASAMAPRNATNPAPAAVERSIDRALIGVWRHTDSFSDAGRGTASLAVEMVYSFKPDGTFTLGSRSAGGDAHTSVETTGKITASGRWSASAGVLTTVNQSGQTGQIHYVFYKGQLVFKKGNGKYVFWNR